MKAGHFNRPINRQIQYNMTTEIEKEKEKLKAAHYGAAADVHAALNAARAARADIDAAYAAWSAADSTCQDAWKKAGAAYDAYEDYKNKNKLK